MPARPRLTSPKVRRISVETRLDDIQRVTDGERDTVRFICPICRFYIERIPRVAWLCFQCPMCRTRYHLEPGREGNAGRYEGGRWVVKNFRMMNAVVGGERRAVKAEDVYIALQQRHPAEKGWLLMGQVRTQVGFHGALVGDNELDTERYLDAFAMHAIESAGFYRVGYEIKVERSDWLRELYDPRKRALGYFLTHEWWFAVAAGIVKWPEDLNPDWADDEAKEAATTKRRESVWKRSARRSGNTNLLDGCGVLQVEEDGTLTVLRHARKRAALELPGTFVASLLRQYVAATQISPFLTLPEGVEAPPKFGEALPPEEARTLWKPTNGLQLTWADAPVVANVSAE